MAQHVEKFDVVAPAQTPASASIATAVTFPTGFVTAITVKIPSGHAGRTGLQIFYGEIQLVPRTSGKHLRGNKVTFRFELPEAYLGGQGWVTDVFNEGRHAHTFQLLLEIDDALTEEARLPDVILLRDSGAGSTVTSGVSAGPTPVGVPAGRE